MRLARNRRAKMPRHYMELRYEDLVSDPEANLRRVCELVELDFDPAMLEPSRARRRPTAARSTKRPPRAGEGRHELDAETRMAAHEMATAPAAPTSVSRLAGAR